MKKGSCKIQGNNVIHVHIIMYVHVLVWIAEFACVCVCVIELIVAVERAVI